MLERFSSSKSLLKNYNLHLSIKFLLIFEKNSFNISDKNSIYFFLIYYHNPLQNSSHYCETGLRGQDVQVKGFEFNRQPGKYKVSWNNTSLHLNLLQPTARQQQHFSILFNHISSESAHAMPSLPSQNTKSIYI